MTLRQQFERSLRITLLVFVLAAACFLSAVTAMRIAIRGRIVSMPDLVGKPSSAAQRQLASRGLQLRVEDRVYSTLPVNSVVRQSPSPGEQLKASQEAHVVLSLGQQTVSIPPLEGNSLRAARISLLEGGLQLGEVSEVYIPASEPETVLRQSPAAGSMAAAPRVDVLVAQGDRPTFYVMPVIVGMSQPDAEHLLGVAGLRTGRITLVSGTDTIKGTVIGQKPAPGEKIAGDVAVELSIANGTPSGAQSP